MQEEEKWKKRSVGLAPPGFAALSQPLKAWKGILFGQGNWAFAEQLRKPFSTFWEAG